MKPIHFITSILLLANTGVFAQKENHVFEATANVAKSQFASAFSWNRSHGIGGKQRFKVGYGLRLTNYFGTGQNYVTAPAKFTSGKQSLAALFSETIAANLDTLTLPQAQVNSLNAAIYLSYTAFSGKLDIGFNIDAIGFSFGAERRGTFLSGGNTGIQTAKPTGFNVLLISDSDRGSLNSELNVRYWIHPKWAIKAGYQFLFTEYTTTQAVQAVPGFSDRNSRFRNKSSMASVGIAYAPFRN